MTIKKILETFKEDMDRMRYERVGIEDRIDCLEATMELLLESLENSNKDD